MFLRLAFGVGLLALGYYVGREMGRAESLRRELEEDHEPLEAESAERPAESPRRPATGAHGGGHA